VPPGLTSPTPSANQARSDRLDVLLVSSAGGHLLQMDLLRPSWAGLSHAWVTHDKEDARSLLEGELVFYAHGPTTRSLVNLLRNLAVAFRLLRRFRPLAIVTVGAGIAVPFAWLARFFGTRVVYVESVTRIESPSLSYRLIAPVANRVYVQWPELAEVIPKAHFVGSVVGSGRIAGSS
jgi:beta-1,4-N-acetylglucosaminyltransferase